MDREKGSFGFTVPRLTPGNGYYFRVAATNGLGTGDFATYWDSPPAPDAAAASVVVPANVPNLVRSAALRSTADG